MPPSDSDNRRPVRDLDILDALVARLRAPDGCPWDREQGLVDLRAYLLEEAHEVADTIDREDWQGLSEELGDLLFQVAFLGRLSEEQGRPGVAHSIDAVHSKMVERHPHVFGDAPAADSKTVARQWERRKVEAGTGEGSVLDGVARSLPALVTAYRMTQKAAGVGFDWPDVSGVFDKLQEEIGELHEATEEDRDRRLEEVGDVLFTVANLARHLGVDPEAALARTNLKFRRRFTHMEDSLRAEKRRITEADLEELEELWQQAKQSEPTPGSSRP